MICLAEKDERVGWLGNFVFCRLLMATETWKLGARREDAQRDWWDLHVEGGDIVSKSDDSGIIALLWLWRGRDSNGLKWYNCSWQSIVQLL